MTELRDKPSDISFESMSPTDFEYLYGLSETTMSRYVEEVWGAWDEVKSRDHFGAALANGEFQSICEGGLRVGALSILKMANHHQIEQLFIEPQHQNRGVGTRVVRQILADAAVDLKPVRLRVLVSNPAKRLYERLGFVVTESTKERHFMECHA